MCRCGQRGGDGRVGAQGGEELRSKREWCDKRHYGTLVRLGGGMCGGLRRSDEVGVGCAIGRCATSSCEILILEPRVSVNRRLFLWHVAWR